MRTTWQTWKTHHVDELGAWCPAVSPDPLRLRTIEQVVHLRIYQSVGNASPEEIVREREGRLLVGGIAQPAARNLFRQEIRGMRMYSQGVIIYRVGQTLVRVGQTTGKLYTSAVAPTQEAYILGAYQCNFMFCQKKY